MIQITELLRTNSVGADRAVLNSNMIILQDAINGFEINLGISGPQNGIDLTGGAGTGILKAKKITVGNTVNGVFEVTNNSNIVKTLINVQSGLGNILTDVLTVNNSITVPNATISTLLTITGLSTFSQKTTHNGTLSIRGGLVKRIIDGGVVSALSGGIYTVFPVDTVVKLDIDATLTLAQPSPQIEDGHEITIISAGSAGNILSTANIAGWTSITFNDGSHKSSITLLWDSTLGSWIVTGSVNVTLA